jgi:hypothetical protein
MDQLVRGGRRVQTPADLGLDRDSAQLSDMIW